MSLWKLIVANVLLAGLAGFGILLVTAPDHPTRLQGAIAWTLFVCLVILAVTLLAILVIGVRRRMQRTACPTR